jgi:pentapeptide MXKDX repeat protein
MKKISIAGAAACLMLLGLANAHAAGMSQDDMKKPGMGMKGDTMPHKAMNKEAKKDGMMHKGGAMQKDMHGAMGKDAMKK